MLVARLEIDVKASTPLTDAGVMMIGDRLEEIDFESLILSRFTSQEIDKLGISVTVRED